MPTCTLCLNNLKDPAALPCGHVFCYDCIIRLVRSITPYTYNHFCPTCKQPYTICTVDPNLVPHHLRSHITPSVRRLRLEYTTTVPTSNASTSSSDSERLLAENASLKTCCFVWRKRSTVHAAATLGLVGLARIARDYALRMKKERDDLEAQYNELKVRYDEKMHSPTTSSSTSSCPSSPRNAQLRSNASPCLRLPHISELCLEPAEMNILPSLARSSKSPRSLSPSPYSVPSPTASDASCYSDCSGCAERKRKRGSSELEDEDELDSERPIKRSHSTSPGVLAPAPQPLSPETAISNYLEGSLVL